MEELRQSCAAKMKQASQKAQRAQQVLQLQVGSGFNGLWRHSQQLAEIFDRNNNLDMWQPTLTLNILLHLLLLVMSHFSVEVSSQTSRS